MGPWKPCLTRRGRRPMWSRCVCVTTMPAMAAGSNGGSAQLRSRRAFSPWYMPESTSARRPAASTRYCDPVTVFAAPRKLILAIDHQGYQPGAGAGSSALQHLAQHRLQDAAVRVVADLDRGVEPGDHREAAPAAVRSDQ